MSNNYYIFICSEPALLNSYVNMLHLLTLNQKCYQNPLNDSSYINMVAEPGSEPKINNPVFVSVILIMAEELHLLPEQQQ